jgi:ribosome maturation factor RimP
LLYFLFRLRELHQSGFHPLFFLEQAELRQEAVLERIRGVAERVTSARGFELTDVEMKRDRGGHLVRIYVDREGGIGLEELQSVSEEVSTILDVEDAVPTSYTLEVSSPGLDRPLRSEADYRRFVGKLVKLSTYEPVEGRRHWTGRLLSLEEGVVSLSLEKEKVVARVPLAKVAHARLEVEFPNQATDRRETHG